MKRLYTAADLATVCDVDLKTIHNWENRGYVKGFRTPGGHRRYKAQDVITFLQGQGYDLPDDLKGPVEP